MWDDSIINNKNKQSGYNKMKIYLKHIPADGSLKIFVRVYAKKKSFVFLYNPIDNNKINENDSYYYIGKHLYNKGIPVPRIYFYNREQGILWIEDVGDIHMQKLIDFNKNPDKSLKYYKKVIDILTKLNIDAAKDFDPNYCYDTSIYSASFIFKRELDYFYREFLVGYMGISSARKIREEFHMLSQSVSDISNNFLIHRDFQSRNILIKAETPYVIDFQGARFGPPTYDIASLIIDPYVSIPYRYKYTLIKEYYLAIKKYLSYSWDEFLNIFWKTALCRNMQVLGAFSFLSIKKKKTFFKKYIPKALNQLKYILEEPLKYEFPLIKRAVFG